MKYSIKYLTVVLIILMTLTQCKKENMKSERCNLVPYAGSCNAAFPKYYFDKNEKKCKVFIWGGCGGVVPFDTKEECEKQCDCK